MRAEVICEELERLDGAGAELDRLLTAAVELLHESNPRFHWTGVYELGADGALRLGPFVGPPTDHVFIVTGQGVCGAAVAEKRNMNIPDVSKVPYYLPCSAATRSELVVLIRKADRIFGQIDIDSDDHDAFDRDAEQEVQRVADWLAGAYERRAGGVG
jgi:GAF domain-containing protein